ncbi:DUF4190 domain-containing protein [Butyrivibrio sp. MC2021]|uniref:DUF4190 domain-containing protein n=1 Tax=Butyrivibrio sp. MC2021 TaxID=1408306 RepID=UPI00047B50BC|nr:DUF4190 domain-containing protein [Butyrivibrio sp. MC2021]
MGENGDDKYFYNNYNYNQEHNELDQHVSLANVAMVAGLLSVPFCFFGYIGIVLGGVAIMMAILSKGMAKKLLPQAKKGIFYGTLGIIVGYAVIISSFHMVMTNPEMRKEVNTFSEQLYGVSFDETLQELMGTPGN